MKKSTDFHDFVVYDLLGRLGNITSKPMMSGWCVYANEIPFAAIIGNNLYLKTKNPDVIAELEKHGSHKFSYEKKDRKIISMNYWLVPEEKLDDTDFILELSEKVIDEHAR